MNSSFDRTVGEEQWLTPPHIIESLGVIDLDPCSPIERPWDTALKHYNKNDDGLSKEWNNFVFANPPYGRETFKWISKLATHGNGVALIFARTDTIGFHKEVFGKADAILFLKGRLKFHRVDGTQGQSAGAPSCLVAYGEEAVSRLENSGLSGKMVYLKGC